MSTVLLVQSRAGYWVGQVAEQLRTAGHRPVLITDVLTEAQREQFASLVDEIVELDSVTDAWALADAARPYGDDAFLFTCADITMVATTEASELLGKAPLPARVIAGVRNKYAARRTLQAAGLPSPGFALLARAEDALAVGAEVGFPAVIKPVNGAGSNMVRMVRNVAELADAYRLLAERVPGAMGGLYDEVLADGDDVLDPATVFLVEGRLQGPEYCMDVVIRGGEIETLKLVGKPMMDDAFFENAFVVPPFGMTEDCEARLREAVVDAVVALGLDETFAHVELIDDAVAGPTIIEVNPGRPGGGLLALVNELTSGVDPFTECLAAVLGLPRPERKEVKVEVPLAYFIFFATGQGRLVKIHGLDEVAAIPEVLRVVPTIEPGQILSNEHEILAVNLLVAGFFDSEDLAMVYEEAAKLIRLETEPVPVA